MLLFCPRESASNGVYSVRQKCAPTARIDKNIAQLIKELWKADLFTFNSCE